MNVKAIIAGIAFSVSLLGLAITYGANKVTRVEVGTMIQTQAPYLKDRKKLEADHTRYEKQFTESRTERKELRKMFGRTLGKLEATNAKLEIVIRQGK